VEETKLFGKPHGERNHSGNVTVDGRWH